MSPNSKEKNELIRSRSRSNIMDAAVELFAHNGFHSTSVSQIAKEAGISSRAFLHKFRHTFATHLVRNRVPLERVQKLLGHSSITETLIYAHLIPDDMHEDVSVLNKLS